MSGPVQEKTLEMMRICASIEELLDRGELTREKFVDAYREAQRVLGDGEEADGIEAIAIYAQDPSWIPPD